MQSEVAKRMGKACITAATMTKTMSRFHTTNICSFNNDLFTYADFIEVVSNNRHDAVSDTIIRSPILPPFHGCHLSTSHGWWR